MAISAGIAVATDAIRVDNGTYNGEATPMGIGALGLSTTSTFAGTTVGLIVFADNGEAMINVESDQAFALYDQLTAKAELKDGELSAQEVNFIKLMDEAHAPK